MILAMEAALSCTVKRRMSSTFQSAILCQMQDLWWPWRDISSHDYIFTTFSIFLYLVMNLFMPSHNFSISAFHLSLSFFNSFATLFKCSTTIICLWKTSSVLAPPPVQTGHAKFCLLHTLYTNTICVKPAWVCTFNPMCSTLRPLFTK